MDDLIGEFITEISETVGSLDQMLIDLERDPNNKDILSNIFRAVHTVKGGCGFFGLSRLEKLAHASENVLGMIRDGKLSATPDAITLILESVDGIKKLVEYLAQHGKEEEGNDTMLIDCLNDFATGKMGNLAPPDRSATPPTAAPTQEAPPSPEPSAPAADDEMGLFIDEKQLAELKKQKSQTDASLPKAAAPATEKPSAAPKEGTGAVTTQSIRVNLDVLEKLMEMVSELVLTRNQLVQMTRSNEGQMFQQPIQQLSYITSELQDGVMKTRMQPIGNAWSKFPRLVRDLSQELDKKIELKMVGEETELDRQLIELIKDPLTHMVRNSCDHGLEKRAERIDAGKPELGTITLSAYHEGGHIIVDISDDGRGLNLDKIKQKAMANGVATAEEIDAMSDQQIMQFIFAAGFSTAEKVTAVSGRGVGMDVVRTNIEKMGGTIELFSTTGKGSRFSIKIPLTLAIVSVLIVEASKQKFAIPQINVLEMVSVSPGGEYSIEAINNAPVLRLREKLLPLGSLSHILGIEESAIDYAKQYAHIVVCKVGGYDFGLIVDRVYDTEEIVVKPVSELLKSLHYYSGNTILGDGSVIMILDPNGIAREIGAAKNPDKSSAASDAKDRSNLPANGDDISFLLFKAGKGAPKAVPLELIARLEEIEVKDIEIAGIDPVVQYRGDLMRLITLGDFHLPNTKIVQVIVFSYDRKYIGLIVDNIIDIVDAPYDVKLGIKENSCLGSMVISGKTTDLVDVSSILSDLIDQAILMHGQNKTHGDNRNILLAEDSPFFRNLTEPFLAAAGYHVTSAENGQEALELLQKYPRKFSVLVTDIEMPVMDGFELTKACRNTPTLSALPIVAYTASMSDESMTKAKKAGANEYVPKTDRPGLLEAIAKHLVVEKGLAA